MLTKQQENIYQRALGSIRMAGQEPSDFAKELVRGELAGEISAEEGRELLHQHIITELANKAGNDQ